MSEKVNFSTDLEIDLKDEVFDINPCYVFFSGGADSTLLLDLVSERCTKMKKECYAVSYNASHYSQAKYQIEDIHRERIISKLRER